MTSNFLIIHEVLKAIESRRSETVTEPFSLTSQELLELHSLFGEQAIEALDLLESKVIFRLYVGCRTGRKLIEIDYRQGNTYKLFPRINYCPCPIFRQKVLRDRSQYTCKHVLAVRLAPLFGKLIETELMDVIGQDQLTYIFKRVGEQ